MKLFRFLVFLLVVNTFQLFADNNSLDLRGEWLYKLDRQDRGVKDRWYENQFESTLILPGSLCTNDIGDKVTKDTEWTGSIWNDVWYTASEYEQYREEDDTKVPFWLTPNRHYKGVAWYQKKIIIPDNWTDMNVFLNMERCHWNSNVWIDSNEMGERNSLSVPHLYNLGMLVAGEHTVTLRIDNRINDIDPGVDAHSISDNTQTNWNGVIGEISLQAKSLINISSLRIEPDLNDKSIKLNAVYQSPKDTNGKLLVEVRPKNHRSTSLKPICFPVTLKEGCNSIDLVYDMADDFLLWDEFEPNLYQIRVLLTTDYGQSELINQFGLRELTAEGTQIKINGKNIFFRGTLECCIFPKTGFPPTTEPEWSRIMGVCKNYGLNHIRFHSWCPPRAAFNVADSLGLYLYIESCAWSKDLGSGNGVDKFVMDESERIITEYGNHPSFCLFSYGNEPAGENNVEYLTEFVNYWKAKDSRFLYTTSSGWSHVVQNDWHCLPQARIQQWDENLNSIINSQHPNTLYDWSDRLSKTHPTISHEIGQWCAYPNLDERKKYTGVLKAKNFDIFEDRLNQSGLLHLYKDFYMASGKLQTICYKAEIEAALRTEKFAGFQLLDLHDFPGQGGAIVGVVDPFWDSKDYVTSSEYREFCNDVVPLVLLDRLTYKSGDTLQAEIKVAQYFKEDFNNCKVKWKVVDSNGGVIYDGDILVDSIECGGLRDIGTISQQLIVDRPSKVQLIVSVNGYSNRWNVWVYPDEKIECKDVLIARRLDTKVVETLKNKGKVLLIPKLGMLKNHGVDSVAVGFSSIFWNTMWTNGQAPHTLGILCESSHPAFELFPTEYHSDYQWWSVIAKCNAIPLGSFDQKIDPIVRIIDDWYKARSLALIIEMNVAGGQLILCGADLLTYSDKYVESNQLINSLLNYMNGDYFNPSVSVDISQIENLYK